MMADWDTISDALRRYLTEQANDHAAGIVAAQAEIFANEMDIGDLGDSGGPHALRMLAAVIRAIQNGVPEPPAKSARRERKAGLLPPATMLN